MDYSLAFEQKGDVLRVTATGMRSLESVVAMSKDIMAECAERKLKYVLFDVRALQGHLDTFQHYELVTGHFSKLRDRSVLLCNALVDLKKHETTYQFLEDVAANRGFNIRVFLDTTPALEWLEGMKAQRVHDLPGPA